MPRIPKKETIKPLDKPDLKRLLTALDGDPEEYLFKVALVTGLRSGELIGLTWHCVDFENSVIRIVQQMTSPRKPGEDYPGSLCACYCFDAKGKRCQNAILFGLTLTAPIIEKNQNWGIIGA